MVVSNITPHVFFGTILPRGFSLAPTVDGLCLIRSLGREPHELLSLLVLGLFHSGVAFAQGWGLFDVLPPRPLLVGDNVF